MICSSTAHVFNFLVTTCSAYFLWSIPDEHVARCVVAALPGYARQAPTGQLGRAAKFFLSAALVLVLVNSGAPSLGQLLSFTWQAIEGVLIAFWSFAWQTIWQSWS